MKAFLRIPGLCLLVASVLALPACETIRPVRTLPSWVRGIYIPMIENTSTEPGLEEVATQLTQEEFLADGRVRIVQKRDADLILKAKITDYWVTIDDLSDEDIPSREAINMITELRLYDPLDPDQPMASLGVIETLTTFRSDTRSARYIVKPDADRQALEQLARQIVDRTITGFPSQLRDIPDGVVIPNQNAPVRSDEESSMRDRLPF